MKMYTVQTPLPDFCYSGRKIENLGGIIVHHFSCSNVDPEAQFNIGACHDLMLDLNLPKDKRHNYLKGERHNVNRMYASAHAFIARDGTIHQLMPFNYEAYHAGASMLNGKQHCNKWTLGIELIGTAKSGFTDAQYSALAELSAHLMGTHGFGEDCIAGHDSVRFSAIQADKAGGRPQRKYDPSGRADGTGNNFDWDRLRGLIAVVD